jgi:hypothetical protein
MRLTIFGQEEVHTRCPECVAMMLDGAHFRKPPVPVYGEAGQFFGDGLATMEDVTGSGETLHRARPCRYCLPRHRLKVYPGNEGSKCV